MLEIIYEGNDLIAINKPHGLLVHRSPIARNTETFAVQELRNQIGQHVFPVHRLDRKTSGVLLFAKNKEILGEVQKQFANQQIQKTYWAVLRGHTEDSGLIDYALTNDKGKDQEALTEYKTLDRCELAVPLGKHTTSRYSLVEAYPKTGRMHQLRKHFAHILHPIIGDRPHGCNKQNRLFKEKWGMTTMLLHARSLEFRNPSTNEKVLIQTGYHSEFERILKLMGWLSLKG